MHSSTDRYSCSVYSTCTIWKYRRQQRFEDAISTQPYLTPYCGDTVRIFAKFWYRQKLQCDFDTLTIYVSILTHCQTVTDRQTDKQTDGQMVRETFQRLLRLVVK